MMAVPGQWGQERYLSGKITAVTVRAEDLGDALRRLSDHAGTISGR